MNQKKKLTTRENEQSTINTELESNIWTLCNALVTNTKIKVNLFGVTKYVFNERKNGTWFAWISLNLNNTWFNYLLISFHWIGF